MKFVERCLNPDKRVILFDVGSDPSYAFHDPATIPQREQPFIILGNQKLIMFLRFPVTIRPRIAGARQRCSPRRPRGDSLHFYDCRDGRAG